LKQPFADRTAAIYRDDEFFARRRELLFPLFSLRWCMILLNEFQPERWSHRINASEPGDWTAAKRCQLERPSVWLGAHANDFRSFPYRT
jgi:hypothetical protein